MLIAALFDRDFWCDEQLVKILDELRSNLSYAHIHHQKEIENYLLIPSAIDRALKTAVADRSRRGGESEPLEPATDIIHRITKPCRNDIQAQYLARREEYLRSTGRDSATVHTETIKWFGENWKDIETRISIVRGKDILAKLRTEVRQRWKVNLTDARIVDSFPVEEIPPDLQDLIKGLEKFRNTQID